MYKLSPGRSCFYRRQAAPELSTLEYMAEVSDVNGVGFLAGLRLRRRGLNFSASSVNVDDTDRIRARPVNSSALLSNRQAMRPAAPNEAMIVANSQIQDGRWAGAELSSALLKSDCRGRLASG